MVAKSTEDASSATEGTVYFTARTSQSCSNIRPSGCTANGVCEKSSGLNGTKTNVDEMDKNTGDRNKMATAKFSPSVMTSTPNVCCHETREIAMGTAVPTPLSLEQVSRIKAPTIHVTEATPDRPTSCFLEKSNVQQARKPPLSLSMSTEETQNYTTRSIRDEVNEKDGLTVSFHGITMYMPNKHTLSEKVANCILIRKSSSTARQEKQEMILQEVSGLYRPGLHALMGPSGCGKSSLLGIIAGRTNKRDYKGKVLVNGLVMNGNFKRFCGFATQDDILIPSLTVREHLHYALALRRCTYICKSERTLLVDELVDDLKLTGCQHKTVGTWTSQSICGGERKRTAIGMELVSSPKVLYLDEPTSKLDSATSRMIVLQLKKLATKGRTVVMSIHQPSYSIYQLCDSLTLLAKGRTIYHGPAEDALGYFATLGYNQELHYSPPDFFLDILFGWVKQSFKQRTTLDAMDGEASYSEQQDMDKTINNNITSNATLFAKNINSNTLGYLSKLDITTVEGAEEHNEIASRLHELYQQSLLHERNESFLAAITQRRINVPHQESDKHRDILTAGAFQRQVDRALKSKDIGFKKKMVRETQLETASASLEAPTTGAEISWERSSESSILLEWMVLTQRVFKCSKIVIFLLGMMNILIGLLFGALYYHPSANPPPSVQNRLGMFFFMSVHGMIFPAMTTAKSFENTEKDLLTHELKGRHYRTGSYCAARCTMTILTRAIVVLGFSTAVYWLAGLRHDIAAFLTFLWTALWSGLAFDALCLLVALTSRSLSSGTTFIVIYLVFSALFAGFLLDIESTFPWIHWIKYISITRYCYLSWVLNEFPQQVLQCPSSNSFQWPRAMINILENTSESGSENDARLTPPHCSYLEIGSVLSLTVGDDHFLMQHPWMNTTILFSMTVAFFVACYVRMRSL